MPIGAGKPVRTECGLQAGLGNASRLIDARLILFAPQKPQDADLLAIGGRVLGRENAQAERMIAR